MDKIKRRDHILDVVSLNADGIPVNELIKEMAECSAATIRRDLVALESNGVIVQSRGRIRRMEQHNPGFNVRDVLNGAAKKAIGQAAAALVAEGDSIVIDSGTTTLALACNLLERKRLSVVTNSIPVAYALNDSAVNVCLCGGTVNDMALVDNDAVSYLSVRRVDKAFIGACGVRDANALTIISSHQYPVKRKMIEAADEVYALLDFSKFSSSGIIVFAEFRELTGIVTSRPVTDKRILEQLDKYGVKLICPETDGAEN